MSDSRAVPRLSARAHVEAVAIIRALRDLALEDGEPSDAVTAADVWLRENHPEPAVYVAALRESASV